MNVVRQTVQELLDSRFLIIAGLILTYCANIMNTFIFDWKGIKFLDIALTPYPDQNFIRVGFRIVNSGRRLIPIISATIILKDGTEASNITSASRNLERDNGANFYVDIQNKNISLMEIKKVILKDSSEKLYIGTLNKKLKFKKNTTWIWLGLAIIIVVFFLLGA